MSHETNGSTGSKTLGFLSGVFLGGLVGAGAALLLAPRAGSDTRRRILSQAETARDQVTHTVEEARASAEKAAQEVTAKVNDLQTRGRELVSRSKQRLTETAAAATAAARQAWAPDGVEPAGRPYAG